ncbi:MAG: DUF1972 domain-containing protein [Bacillota bacterium]|nr:DUF1972 domain-containing protein [Bacillota bacterium]
MPYIPPQQNMVLEAKTLDAQHIFIIGAKSIGQYGGYETFVDKLTEQHQNDSTIKYHIACKANGDGFMDENKLDGVEITKKNRDGSVLEFTYHNAHVFKIPCPNIGPAVAIYYDRAAVKYGIKYCKDNNIKRPIFYILTCRIGPFIEGLVKQIKAIGGIYMLNPDGHEWMRAKWSAPVRRYWKWSEKKMVDAADIVVCDSVNIENYIKEKYKHPHTVFIAYGSDTKRSVLSDDDPKFTGWLQEKSLKTDQYYLVVGRFVPENNYETMIREYMKSHSKRDFAIITNANEKLKAQLEKILHFNSDPRIKFVGTVYDKELLKKIRENAYGYFHGHEVGGTNPSLLEAMGSTALNLLLDVGFNKEVGIDAALYWSKKDGDLAALIDTIDTMDEVERKRLGTAAKNRIKAAYSWQVIGDKYKRIWNESI